MQKTRIEYNSNLDALISTSKRLSALERQYHMASEEFYDKYSKGLMEDSVDFTEWANDYQHYLAIYCNIDKKLRHVA